MNILLAGQPNVGKTSIFNKLVLNKKNIVHKESGTTRDWHYNQINNVNGINLYDTPGIVLKNKKLNLIKFNKLFNKIDLIFYVIDFKNYDNLSDKEAIDELRKLNKKIVLLLNKNDNMKNINNFNFYGFNEFFSLSCSHNLGFDKILNFIQQYENDDINQLNYNYSISIFGKPNAGKSTILNKILGYNRAVTSNIPGTTTDIVEEISLYKNYSYKIIDTAGIYKKNKINSNSINFFAVKKTIEYIKNVNLVILIIDSTEGFDTQVKKIFNILLKDASNLFIIFNKFDLIKDKKKFKKEMDLNIHNNFSSSKFFSIYYLSSKNNNNIKKLKNLINSKLKKIKFDISTNKLNLWLSKSTNDFKHPLIKRKEVKFKYAVQVSANPIIIKLFCNFAKEIKDNYKNYLLNSFHSYFDLKDINVKIIISKNKNPYI